MTTSEEDRALAEQCVLFSSYPIDEVVHAFATIRARAAAEATERAAKIADQFANNAERRYEQHASQTAKDSALDKMVAGREIAAAIRADLTAGQRENKRAGE